MTLPGPGLGAWALALLVFAAASAILGGALRTFVVRWVPAWRSLGPIERLVLDLYLGGGTVYAVALLPLGLFTAATFPTLVVLALAYLLFRVVRLGRSESGRAVVRAVRGYLGIGPGVALVAAAALGALELAIAVGIPTGNTYDASQLATYTALLLAHHSVPTNLAGLGLSGSVSYPQGATVWMGTAQLLFGLPAARTALLVTPLFFGLAPLGGYALGDRWLGGPRGGAVLAVALAVLATWTRLQVSGSYDFVAAFPLTLLVIALSRSWVEPTVVPWGDVVAFGLLAGYAAALNPVGVGWWLLALPFAAGAAAAGRWFGDARAWLARYAVALVAAAIPIAPSLAAVARGRDHIGFAGSAPGVGTLAPVGLTGSQIVGYVDPLLFGATDQGLSPFPVLRLELAGLLVVGALLLAVLANSTGDRGPVRRLAFGAIASAGVLFLVEWLASLGVRPFPALAPLTNGAELSEMLFTAFVVVAAVPVVALLEWKAADPTIPDSVRRPRWSLPAGSSPRGPTWAIAVALLLFVPGVAVTATEMPGTVGTLYRSFGNVSAGDFAMLAWAGTGLPAGARVLVAPGSAAEFLPAYAPQVRVVYPVVLGFDFPNLTYRDLNRELSNGTLEPNGHADLLALGVGYIVVTGRNSVLGTPYSTAPLFAEPSEFALVEHAGDAYVFEYTPGTLAPTAGSGGLR
ncbi:MAG: hypothetical protein L3K16_01950 [Thermoplasmata archaeon]|nr:hypothetical protein [Thermoplasmata archaeon]